MVKERQKTVSVAMTTYNGEKYIEKQLKSIFNQEVMPDEIVICDDCSTDSTIEIIHRVVADYGEEDRVHLVQNLENLGYIRNFHKAIGMTSGELLFLADQDDEWYPNKIKRVLEIITETGAEVVCTSFDLIDENSNFIEDTGRFRMDSLLRNAGPGLTPITFRQLVYRNFVPGCTYCCTRRVVQKYLEIESQVLPHDYQIMFVGTLLGSVFFLNEKTIGYRLHGNNTIGMVAKGASVGFQLKKPKRKPKFVHFLDDVSRAVTIPNRWYYNMLYYLRIPYLAMAIKNKLEERSW